MAGRYFWCITTADRRQHVRLQRTDHCHFPVPAWSASHCGLLGRSQRPSLSCTTVWCLNSLSEHTDVHAGRSARVDVFHCDLHRKRLRCHTNWDNILEWTIEQIPLHHCPATAHAWRLHVQESFTTDFLPFAPVSSFCHFGTIFMLFDCTIPWMVQSSSILAEGTFADTHPTLHKNLYIGRLVFALVCPTVRCRYLGEVWLLDTSPRC